MLNIKRLCFAAAAVTIGSSAFAQINSPSTGPSDVFLAVWNPNTNQSIVEDLNITESTFESTTGTQQFTIDGSTSAFQSALSISGGNTTGDLYVVFAGNANGANNDGFFFDDTYADFTGTASPPASVLNQGGVQQVASAVGNFVTGQMVPGNKTTLVASGASNSGYWAKGAPGPNPGQALGGPNSFNASGAVGANLNYYYALNADPDDQAADAPTVTQFAGLWNLSSTGTLTWTPNASGPTTPLPAAVWMLLSGLLGLGTVSRRKSV
jgi:hypothetical protein